MWHSENWLVQFKCKGGVYPSSVHVVGCLTFGDPGLALLRALLYVVLLRLRHALKADAC